MACKLQCKTGKKSPLCIQSCYLATRLRLRRLIFPESSSSNSLNAFSISSFGSRFNIISVTKNTTVIANIAAVAIRHTVADEKGQGSLEYNTDKKVAAVVSGARLTILSTTEATVTLPAALDHPPELNF